MRLPFPPDTLTTRKAFLFYSITPEKTRIAGELRLRVASSPSDDLNLKAYVHCVSTMSYTAAQRMASK
jgi:hypothetical protein